MRLGRLPHSPAALARVPAMQRAALSVPAMLRRENYHPRMFHNDTFPCCTAAALANGALAVSAVNDFETLIDDAAVPRFYAACIGQPDATAADLAATHGAVMLDVLTRQLAGGFDVGQIAPLVGVFGRLSLSQTALAAAMERLGGVYAGITLYERDMEAFASGRPPDLGPPGEALGGHAVWLWDYPDGLADGDAVRIATWGALASCPWAWVRARLEEAYGVMWRQLSRADGLDLGVSADVLAGDLRGMVAG